MEPQPPSPALSCKVMPPEPLPKGSVRCLDPHARAMVSGAGGCWDASGSTGPEAAGTQWAGDTESCRGTRRDVPGRELL